MRVAFPAPQPVIMACKATEQAGEESIELLADTGTSRGNVPRMARRKIWQVEIQAVEHLHPDLEQASC